MGRAYVFKVQYSPHLGLLHWLIDDPICKGSNMSLIKNWNRLIRQFGSFHLFFFFPSCYCRDLKYEFRAQIENQYSDGQCIFTPYLTSFPGQGAPWHWGAPWTLGCSLDTGVYPGTPSAMRCRYWMTFTAPRWNWIKFTAPWWNIAGDLSPQWKLTESHHYILVMKLISRYTPVTFSNEISTPAKICPHNMS